MVVKILLRVRQTRSHATDVELHLLGGGGGAIFQRAVLFFDAWALVGKADGVAIVENRDGRLNEIRVDEVLDNLANDHEGDVATLLARKSCHLGGDFFKVAAHVGGIDDHHARRRRGVVIDGNTRCVACLYLFFLALLDEGVKRAGHRAPPDEFDTISPSDENFQIFLSPNERFQQLVNDC